MDVFQILLAVPQSLLIWDSFPLYQQNVQHFLFRRVLPLPPYSFRVHVEMAPETLQSFCSIDQCFSDTVGLFTLILPATFSGLLTLSPPLLLCALCSQQSNALGSFATSEGWAPSDIVLSFKSCSSSSRSTQQPGIAAGIITSSISRLCYSNSICQTDLSCALSLRCPLSLSRNYKSISQVCIITTMFRYSSTELRGLIQIFFSNFGHVILLTVSRLVCAPRNHIASL